MFKIYFIKGTECFGSQRVLFCWTYTGWNYTKLWYWGKPEHMRTFKQNWYDKNHLTDSEIKILQPKFSCFSSDANWGLYSYFFLFTIIILTCIVLIYTYGPSKKSICGVIRLTSLNIIEIHSEICIFLYSLTVITIFCNT